jgi:hypothetical protein
MDASLWLWSCWVIDWAESEKLVAVRPGLAGRGASGARAGIHIFHDIPYDILIDINQIYYDFRT